MDKGKYLLKNEDRVKFRIRVPRELWDWLPKIIARDLSAPDTTEIGSRCQACGQDRGVRLADSGSGVCSIARWNLIRTGGVLCADMLYYTHQPESRDAVSDDKNDFAEPSEQR